MTSAELLDIERLNELKLTETEEAKALGIFSMMDKEVERIKGLDTENVEIMVYCMPMTNVFREDTREQVFSREELLDGAPERSDNSWVVPRLVK